MAGYERAGVSVRMRAALADVPAPLDVPVRRIDLECEDATGIIAVRGRPRTPRPLVTR